MPASGLCQFEKECRRVDDSELPRFLPEAFAFDIGRIGEIEVTCAGGDGQVAVTAGDEDGFSIRLSHGFTSSLIADPQHAYIGCKRRVVPLLTVRPVTLSVGPGTTYPLIG